MIKIVICINFIILICFQPFEFHNIMMKIKIKECYKMARSTMPRYCSWQICLDRWCKLNHENSRRLTK